MLVRSPLVPAAFRSPWADFDRFFSDFPSAAVSTAVPAIDAVETDDGYVLKLDVPGVAPSDIEISVEGDTVYVSGERKAESEEKKENYVRRERTVGKFSRTVTLPYQIDNDKVAAKVRDGVLELRLPKRDADKPKRISVKAA